MVEIWESTPVYDVWEGDVACCGSWSQAYESWFT